jgi:uncharacterized protein YjbJ (UPF0337 family)
MNWDRFEGKCKQLSGRVKEKWGEITNNQWAITEGKRHQRVGQTQESYGIGKEQAERMLRDWTLRSNRSASL